MQVITIRISDEAKDRLEKIASGQHRSLSNLARIILLKWLEDYDGEMRLPKEEK
jgi:predicted transcriptional regulator